MEKNNIFEIYKKLEDKIKLLGIQSNGNKIIGYLFIDQKTMSSFLIDKNEINFEIAILNRLDKMEKMFK